ncbi:MAG TPA: hypothetical protein VEA41_16385 [Salinarimonas sp.]|nr:hypothetical protein [Salinarimonas sp.]
MNHKRRRPKHQRAGCICCKPHKDEREAKAAPVSAERRMQEDHVQEAADCYDPNVIHAEYLDEYDEDDG